MTRTVDTQDNGSKYPNLTSIQTLEVHYHRYTGLAKSGFNVYSGNISIKTNSTEYIYLFLQAMDHRNLFDYKNWHALSQTIIKSRGLKPVV